MLNNDVVEKQSLIKNTSVLILKEINYKKMNFEESLPPDT
jgi:hypothetical protein